MASHNPNTKQGRRKNKEEFQKNYNQKTQDEKDELDSMIWWGRFVLFIIIIIVCFIVIALGGEIN